MRVRREGVESGHQGGEGAEKDIERRECRGESMEKLEKRDVWACAKSVGYVSNMHQIRQSTILEIGFW